MTKRTDEEDRNQQRLRRLGTNNPICPGCGETHPATFEGHHIAGKKRHADVAPVCANCHRKLSSTQRDHVPSGPVKPNGPLAVIGHYMLGLADLFAMIVETLRRFGLWLIAQSQQEVAA